MTTQTQNPVWGFDTAGTGVGQRRVNSATQGWTYQAQAKKADGTPAAANIDLLVRNIPGGDWSVAANIVLPNSAGGATELFLSSALWMEHNVRVNSMDVGAKVLMAGMGVGDIS